MSKFDDDVRRIEETFGEVTEQAVDGSSGVPVRWAFIVDHEPELVVGCSENVRELFALVGGQPYDNLVTCLQTLKLIEHHSEPDFKRTFGEFNPLLAGESRLFLVEGSEAGIAVDFVVVPLHLREMGLDPEATLALIKERETGFDAIRDPRAMEELFPRVARLVRSARRLVRLEALTAPQIIIDDEVVILSKLADELSDVIPSWNLPDDVLATVKDRVS